MVCPNCGKETKGIKLNGKLFCTFCGETLKSPAEILEESYQGQDLSPKTETVVGDDTKEETRSTEAKIITPEGDTKDNPPNADLLEAEEEVLEVIEKMPTPKVAPIIKDTTIKKHQRQRADRMNFDLIEGEPDPIAEPELESPKEDLISDNVQEKVSEIEMTTADEDDKPNSGFPLMPKEQRDELKARAKHHQDLLNIFLKETAGALADKKPKKKQKNKRRQKNGFRWTWIVAPLLILVILLIGVTYYVNVYATDPIKISSDIKDKTTFVYTEPQAAPGYEISYLSSSDKNYAEYYFTFIGDKKRFVIVRIEPTTITKTQVQTEVVNKENTNYSLAIIDGLEFWQTENHRIFVLKNDLLYTFSSSSELSTDELLNYAEETLL